MFLVNFLHWLEESLNEANIVWSLPMYLFLSYKYMQLVVKEHKIGKSDSYRHLLKQELGVYTYSEQN